MGHSIRFRLEYADPPDAADDPDTGKFLVPGAHSSSSSFTLAIKNKRRRPGGSVPWPPTPCDSDVQQGASTSEQHIPVVAEIASGDTSGDATMLPEEPNPFQVLDDTVTV